MTVARPVEPAIWASSGYDLLDVTSERRLVPTPSFLKAYLARPELAPVAESCAEERALHARLLAAPLAPVESLALAGLADPDAAENYRLWLEFRDRLLGMTTVEAAYLELAAGGGRPLPPLFVEQLAHVVLRHILDGEADAFLWRAAECLFRPQRVAISEGGILVADEETVERAGEAGDTAGDMPGDVGEFGRLLAAAGTAPRSVELDVLSEANAAAYAGRSERHDFVLDIAFTRPGQDALARVLERWVRHFLAVEVRIEPVQTIRDERWAWHVGLDATATGILNAMWHGQEVPQHRLAQVLGLFRLAFRDPAQMLPRIAGRPVYLALAMDERRRLRLKPQNLLTGLPLRAEPGLRPNAVEQGDER